MKINRYSILDEETGELLPYKPKGKYKNKTIYSIYFPVNKTIHDYFIKYMTSTNIVQVKKRDVIKELNLSERLYTKEIRRLIADNFCIRLSNDCYFINPDRTIKGGRSQIMKLRNFYKNTKIDIREKELKKLEKQYNYKQYATRVTRNPLELIKTA